MNKLLPFILIIFIPLNSFSQRANNWYFGERAGIRFTSSGPVALFDNPIGTIDEGSASISDNNGNLLFYTDGLVINNRLHQTMPNGNGIMTLGTVTQPAIIIPIPGDTSRYYVFTADGAEDHFRLGYRYSVVDMRLDNGNGDVTAEKNIRIDSPSTEKIAAVKHSNGLDYWLITKQFGNNRFKVFRIDCNGVDINPVISDVGFPLNDWAEFNGIGQLKVSADGKKIGLVASNSAFTAAAAEILDFDASTGIISNPITLDLSNFISNTLGYGIEFSPDSKKVYVTNGDLRIINQYDLSSSNPSAIYHTINASYGVTHGLQLGPDGKIYIANLWQPYLSVIASPNNLGSACNYLPTAVSLGGRICRSSFPSFPVNLISPYFNNFNTDFSTSYVDCYIRFSGSSTLAGNLKWYWDFGDGTFDSLQTVKHSYRQAGTYNVRLKLVTSNGCASDSFFVVKPVTVTNVFAIDFGLQGNCLAETYLFSDSTRLNNGAITNYNWYFGDGGFSSLQNPAHVYASAGQYQVKLVVSTSGICRADSITRIVYVDNKPLASFSAINGCVNTPVIFNDQSTNNTGSVTSWLWDFNDNSNSVLKDPQHIFSNYGNYAVKLIASSAHGCSDDTTKIINIESKPVASFGLSKPCADETIQFFDSSRTDFGNIVQWKWKFGDGQNSTLQSPTHVYQNGGPVQVSLQVVSQNQCVSDYNVRDFNLRKLLPFAGNDTFALYNQPLGLNGSGGDFYEWSPSAGLSDPQINNPVAILQNDANYTLKVSSVEGCVGYDDIIIKVYTNFDALVPSAFTPNADGVNDFLRPILRGIKTLDEFKIYNRFGKLVYSFDGINNTGWDGTVSGVLQPSGAYAWRVRATDIFGRKVERRGMSVLLK